MLQNYFSTLQFSIKIKNIFDRFAAKPFNFSIQNKCSAQNKQLTHTRILCLNTFVSDSNKWWEKRNRREETRECYIQIIGLILVYTEYICMYTFHLLVTSHHSLSLLLQCFFSSCLFGTQVNGALCVCIYNE